MQHAIFASRSPVRFGGTADAFTCIISLRNFDVVLLAGVLPLFAEVDHFLVQQLVEQFDMLQTSPEIALFPEPILSNAYVVQRILDVAVAKRLPSVVLEDSSVRISPPYF